MKRYLFVLAALLPILSACRVDENAFNGTTLYGDLSQFTKTTLGEDGLTVTWAAGDSIGVSSETVGNNRFVLTSESVGQTKGTFKGSMTGVPVAAYYPYNPSASSSDVKSVKMTLPATQTAQGTQPDMKLDVKVAGIPSGSMSQGFTFDFQPKLTLLRFDLTPDSSLDGKTLSSISLSVKSRTLAGDYEMSLEDTAEELSFSTSKNSVNLIFADTPQLTQDEPVVGWMFINPAIEEGDALSITVTTDELTLVADVTANKDYLAGYRYAMPLDIAELRKAGKIREEGGEGTVFTDITKYGVFDLSKSEIYSILTYTEGEDQFTTYSNSSYAYYSIVNVHKGKAFKASFSKKSLTVGTSYTIKTNSAGIGISDATYNATLVKQTSNMFWFRDDTNNLGFILYR